MNLQNITFDNKSYINQNANVPNVNKVTDDDLNEIKSVINANNNTLNDSLFYKPGDVIEIGNAGVPGLYVANGYITSSTKSVFVTIAVPKRLDNISTSNVSVNNLNVELRGISGYLNSASGYIEYVGKSGYTITAWKSSNNTITIRLQKSSAFTNVTNNTPAVLAGYFKLTLS